jgi:hypothetical protein
MLRSKSLRGDSSATGERGKTNPFGPSLERGFSGPIKGLSGIVPAFPNRPSPNRSPTPRAEAPRSAVAAFRGRERAEGYFHLSFLRNAARAVLGRLRRFRQQLELAQSNGLRASERAIALRGKVDYSSNVTTFKAGRALRR